MKTPQSIADHVLEDVSLSSIRAHWSDLLRLVATFEAGWTSATQLLQVFGSAARGEGVYLAGTSLGKLLRTIYLCDYYTLPEFRHEIYRTIERRESVHALQRAIHIGTIPARRGRDLAEFGVVSGALALMTDIVMAFNAGQLQKSVDAEVANGTELSECMNVLRRLSTSAQLPMATSISAAPMHFRSIGTRRESYGRPLDGRGQGRRNLPPLCCGASLRPLLFAISGNQPRIAPRCVSRATHDEGPTHPTRPRGK